MITEFEKRWQEKFDTAARTLDRNDSALHIIEGNDFYRTYFLEYFKKYIKKDNFGTKVLDVGCGTGIITKLLAEKGFQVWGVDYSAEVIEVAKRKVRGVNFQVADVYHLPFQKETFDIVLCLGVFQTIEEPAEALTELRRVLKKGGVLLITTLNKFSLTRFLIREEVKTYNPFVFKKEMQKSGFWDVDIRGIFLVPESWRTIADFLFRFKIYVVFNFLFFFFVFFSHSFYIEGRKL